ncbi:hypothetical protein KAR91_10300, partial [Candidatus Pacearchaeota archaeon]|nr:hypothetical protein [Candidatus Pacearchaeota archaeon]
MTRALQFKDGHRYLLETMFKESAKTSWARIAIMWRVMFQKNWFMLYVCQDHKKAKSHLYDIALELQTNKRLLQDFGQVFYEQSLEDTGIKKSHKKSIDEFITTTGIKLKAFSTGMSTRGELHMNHRPDYYTLDDFENEKTKVSEARTKEVKAFIDELLTGISASAKVVFLGNKISKRGSVAFLEKKALDNPDFKALNVPLIVNDEIMWKSRFVWTDARARMLNKDQPDEKHVFSIEERKRTVGTRRFNQEYLNIPIPEEEALIKQEWVEPNMYKTLPGGQIFKIIMLDP